MKDKILNIIHQEIRKYRNEKSSFYVRYFTTKGDKRFFSGAINALENLEDIIYTKLNDGDKIHIGKELPTYDIKGKRVSAVNFRFDIEQIEFTLSTGMGSLEQKKYLTITFEMAQKIGLLNLQVLNNYGN